MRDISIEDRAIMLAKYIISSKDTVRGTAAKYGVSKSTVHKDVSERLIRNKSWPSRWSKRNT